MANATNRTGFGPSAGSLNPRVLYSEVEPVSPRSKDIWVNTLNNSIKRWDAEFEEWSYISRPTLVLTQTEYDDLDTPDPDTLYYII